MKNSPKITLIIPCYNEEMWLETTLNSLLQCPTISEIIAINDGSKDNTLSILNKFDSKIKTISFAHNHGKGYVLSKGIVKSQGEIIVFIDAHVLKVTNIHFQKIIKPLIDHKADAALATTGSPSYLPDLFWQFTGFRAYYKSDLVPLIPKMQNTRFGVEAFLNDAFKKKSVKVLKFTDIIHLPKQQKMPPREAFPEYLKEAIEIINTYALLKGIDSKNLKRLLDVNKIKTVKSLKEILKKINDKELLTLLKKYLLSYIK